MIFAQSVPDTSVSQNVHKSKIENLRPVTINPKTGKAESVLANMEAIYPDWPQMDKEMSFEELRAANRGWLSKDWSAEKKEVLLEQDLGAFETIDMDYVEPPDPVEESLAIAVEERLIVGEEYELHLEERVGKEGVRESRNGRPKKMKVMEVRGEPQTSMSSLKIWRKIADIYLYSQGEPRVTHRP